MSALTSLVDGVVGAAVVGTTAAAAWASTEVGRAALTGSAGGLARWLLQKKRVFRDLLISVAAGALFAVYTSSGVRAVFERFVGPLADGPNTDTFAQFSAGLVGVALAKVALAFIEKYEGPKDAE